MTKKEPIYRIIFSEDTKTYELYARYISEETMAGFVELDQLIFSEDKVLVDPNEEKMKAEFRNVERIYIPIHAIFRIDEVVQKDRAALTHTKHPETKSKSNVWRFPVKNPGEDNTDA